MLGMLSIALALTLLIYLAYRGVSVVIVAPIMASLAVLLAGETLILGAYTQIFMTATGNFIILYFPLFLLGAIFGKLMDDSGSAQAIAQWAVRKFGEARSILVVVLSCALLTYGGVSLFVVAFAVVPIAEMLFRNNGLPKRLIPGAVALGAFSFTMTALPGTPAIQNAIPMPAFGTTPFAAPVLGIIAGAIMLALGMWWLNYRARTAAARGEGFGLHAEAAPQVDQRLRVHADAESFDIGELCDKPAATGEPSIFIALLPIVAVISLNLVFSKYVLPALDTSFLAQPEYGEIELGAVIGIWSIIAALACSIVLVAALNYKRFADFTASIDSGANASVMPIFNTASLVGFGAVIAILPAFATITAGLFRLGGDNPLVSLSLSVSVLAGITGSASGGMSIVLQAVGAKFVEMAVASGVSLDLLHRVAALAAGGLDCLPHGGAVITLLQICNLKHKDSYLDIFAVAVVGPVVALITVIILGSLFGSF